MTQRVRVEHDPTEAPSRAEMAATSLHRLLRRLLKIARTIPGLRLRISVIGYGAQVGPIWCGALAKQDLVALSELATTPMRIDHGSDGAPLPVWFEPDADGPTPMVAALSKAHDVVAGWIAEHESGAPPVVVNISDGASTDGDPRPAAARLQQLRTSAGNVRVFNVHIGDSETEAVWWVLDPSASVDPLASTLFEMSSTLPDPLRTVAATSNIAAVTDPRGFVFNADGGDLDTFLRVGTFLEVVT